MRPSVWVSLLVLVAVGAGIRAHATSSRASGRATSRAPAASAVPRVETASWVVEGKWEKGQDDAVASALREAEAKVAEYLRAKDARLAWLPKADYIREHLWRDLALTEVTAKEVGERHEARLGGRVVVEEQKDFADDVGPMRKVYVKVAVGPEELAAIQRQDGKYREHQRKVLSQERQVVLAKVLAGVVTVLVTLAGYFRLEEATKGYYTAWLRVAALGLVAAVVAGLVLVA